MEIVDAKGVWFANRGFYPLADPESGTVFEPNLLTRATLTTWVTTQPCLERVADPLAPDEPVKVEKPTKPKA